MPLCLLGFLALLAHPIGAQESASDEKIRDVSPDKKFAMRIRCDAETNKQLIEGEKADAEKIFSETIKAIELVSLPFRQVVANLLPDEELGAETIMTTSRWFGLRIPNRARFTGIFRASVTPRFTVSVVTN
jgi:hypothetical protein